MIAFLLNHLWQSSVCLGVAGVITLALRRNSANIRFWVWFAASLKFLVPFAALTALSTYALAPMVPPIAVPNVRVAEPIAQPFSAPMIIQITGGLTGPAVPPARSTARPTPPHSAPQLPLSRPNLESILLAIWVAGFLGLAVRWFRWWLQVRSLVRDAGEAQLAAPVEVKYSPSLLEPGLVGIIAPVILLPKGIERELSPAELKAVLAHELCHWRRRDNLWAAIHMVVEALFWFFPLVWWLGARLNAERERACDEGVLAEGNDPQVYTNGILKVCSAYLQSRLACVAGVSGAGLKSRIVTILENRLVVRLGAAGRTILSTCVIVALAFPVVLGLLTSPIAQVQAKAAPMPLGGQIAESDERTQSDVQQPPNDPPVDQAGGRTAAAQSSHGDRAAPTADKGPSHLLSRLLTRSLTVPAPDWSHLLSPVSPTLFAANDPPPASAQPTASDSPTSSVRLAPNADATAVALNGPHQKNVQLLVAAETFCADKQVRPSDLHYLACLDIYLGAHSVNLIAKPLADGSLEAVPTPVFPHSTFHAVQGLGGTGGICLPWQNSSPAQFQNCLDHVFASQCGAHASGSYELQMLGACDWRAERGAEEDGTKHPPQSPAKSPIDELVPRQASEARSTQTAPGLTPSSTGGAGVGNCAPPKLVNSLPLEKVPGSDTMTVSSTFNGKPAKLLVDVGAVGTKVWETQAEKLDLPMERGPFARVGSLVLGSVETGHLYLQVMGNREVPQPGFDGVLGTDLMHGYDIDLDFAHQELNYFSPEQCKGGGIYWNPSTVSSVRTVPNPGNFGQLPFVPVTLDGHTIIALLDTGADRTFLNPSLAKKLFGLTPSTTEAVMVTTGGAIIPAGTHQFLHLTFGGLTANNPEIAIPFDNPLRDRGSLPREDYSSRLASSFTGGGLANPSKILPDMVIGMDVLKHSHLYISFENQTVYISAAGDGPALTSAPTQMTWLNRFPPPPWGDGGRPSFYTNGTAHP